MTQDATMDTPTKEYHTLVVEEQTADAPSEPVIARMQKFLKVYYSRDVDAIPIEETDFKKAAMDIDLPEDAIGFSYVMASDVKQVNWTPSLNEQSFFFADLSMKEDLQDRVVLCKSMKDNEIAARYSDLGMCRMILFKDGSTLGLRNSDTVLDRETRQFISVPII